MPRATDGRPVADARDAQIGIDRPTAAERMLSMKKPVGRRMISGNHAELAMLICVVEDDLDLLGRCNLAARCCPPATW